jgi:hypothetical protein
MSFRQYRKIEPKEFILCAVDTAAGGGDYTAGQFLSKSRLDVPLVYHANTTTSDAIAPLAQVLERIHDATGLKPVVAFERQNGGSFLIDRLAAINYANKYEIFKMPVFGRNIDAMKTEPQPTVLGWDTTSATRPKMLQDLKDAIDHRSITIYDKPTIGELFSFVVAQTTSSWKAQAERGKHDDLVMALAIAWQLYQYCQPPVSVATAQTIAAQFPDEKLFTEGGFY